MMRHIARLLSCGVLAILSAQVLPVGTADGVLKDPSGSLLAGAKVTLKNLETGLGSEAKTNDIGYYLLPLVNPGRYEVAAEMQGFKKATQTVVIETGKRTTVDFSLELGAVTESVEVFSSAALLQTSTAAIAHNVRQREIQDLPLLGRNPLKLMLLSAGVTANATTSSSLLDVNFTSLVSVNGSNRHQNEFMLDGIPNNIADRVNYIPPTDVVEEFTIQTSALDAEYGHGGGAYINVTSKSGTNEFHGQIYEFFRNEKLNANYFFNNKYGAARPPFRYNQFGAAAGGPVIKDKVFWFFNWEAIRQDTPTGGLFTTPTDLQRQGDFSKTLDSASRMIEIYNPFSTKQNAAGQWVRDPFPGNKIPASMFDPVARNIMARYPASSQPGDPITGVNNLYKVLHSNNDGDSYSVRVDPNLGRHRAFARWSFNKLVARTEPPADIGGPEGVDRGPTSIGVSDTYALTPSTIITAQAGYSRWSQTGVEPPYELASLGFPTSLISQMQQQVFPAVGVAGIMAIGAKVPNWFEHTNTLSTNAGITRMAGRHNLKAGFQMQVKQNNGLSYSHTSGSYSFTPGFTQGPAADRVAANSGSGMASFLVGAGSGSIFLNASLASQAPYYGGYFQDEFKVGLKLTLSLGLRYEVTLGATERYNRNVFGFDQVNSNPIEAQAQANYARNPIPELAPQDFHVRGSLLFTTPENRRNGITDKNNWAPRVGAAYRLFPRTVLRGGFGVFYSFFWQPFVRQDGFSSQTDMVSSNDGGRTPADLLRDPFPRGLVQPIGSTQGMKSFLGTTVQAYDQFRKAVENDRWSFSLQQEVRRDLMFEIAYVGQRAKRLPLSSNSASDNEFRNIDFYQEKWLSLGQKLNDPVPNPFYGLIPSGTLSRATVTRSQLLLTHPHYTGVNLQRISEGKSSYHSLQVTANKRMSFGLTVQGGYTWSRSLDELRYINLWDPAPSKMIGEHDNPHRIAMAVIYELPFGHGKPVTSRFAPLNKVFGGWQFSGLYIYQTGVAAWLLPVLATGISPKIADPTIDNYFNRDSMKVLPPFTPRRIPCMWNDLRQPSMNNWDIAILKQTVVYKERVRLQFRAELNNAFNRVWFGIPEVSPTNLNYGRITTQANNPRDIQFALKLMF